MKDSTTFDGYEISRKEMLRFYILGALICGCVGWLFYRTPAALVLCVLPVLFRRKYMEYSVYKRKEKINIQFKDVLYAFSDSAASGRQAASAIYAAGRNLRKIYGDDDYLTMEFTEMAVRVREMNEAPEKLLMEFSRNCDVEDIRNFLEIYCICIKSGGDREKAINKAVEIIGEKINLRQELANVLVQKKLEAVILCSITPAILFFLQLTSTGYTEALYVTLAGKLVMTLCLCATLFAAGMCLRIMDIRI